MSTDDLARPSIGSLQDRLTGFALPGGTCTIPAYEHWLAADAMLSPELPPGQAHPLYIFYLALLGMGVSIDDLYALADTTVAEGPMLGETELIQHRVLRVGTPYHVTGKITGIERRTGRRIGVFDTMQARLELSADLTVDDPAAVCANSFIIPRRT